ncbi:hypothetical protein IG3_01244 [Bacillus cereus HuA2-1]|uniref:Clp R domain-containing protein n=1 Tax=Bacillus cereus HuA2-1 TaxID=1053201 RepID=J9CR32_BACCE|nr:hypothetical protein IG3_01244 [Bacillus cereus HuA2-1]
MMEFQFTKRAYKILEIAAEEAECSKGIIHPVHLFIGACKEGTGVCAELHMYGGYGFFSKDIVTPTILCK